MKLASSLLSISLALSSNLANALENKQELSLPVTGISSLNATVGAGEFTLVASDNLSEIKVEAELVNAENHKPELSLERQGDSAVLIARFEETVSSFGKSPMIHVTLTVPATLALELVDGSGNIDIRGLKSDVRIKDGSGNLSLDGGMKVSIDDGSGNLRVANIEGKLNITDGSGDLEVSDAKGDMQIQDGSGNIRITNAGGKVELTDGSGNIEVNGAAELVIHDAGSGNVRTSNIRSSTDRKQNLQ